MLAAIRTRFSAAKEFLQKHRRLKVVLVGVACLVVLVSLVSFVHPAHAAPAPSDSSIGQLGFGDFFSVDGWKRIFSAIMLDIASLFLRIALFFLTFIIELSAYNGYLDATAVNVGWVMVRDVTNMFFVVALLIIAFGTILGIEQYEWKKLLVKFVLSAVLVNFSRLICGVLIDMSQIVMQTFVNGIAATAGGNLINMFNLDKITKLSANANASDISPGIFTASVAAVTFAGMVMMTLGIFVFMLVARVIRLWILIVLSPLAFVLSVIPLTEKYAGQWWTEMGDDLVTGPVLLFFIWLSFVSLGGGDVNTQIAQSAMDNGVPPEQVAQPNGTSQADQVGAQSAGIGDAMGWNQLANFAIAVGMMFAGARVASTIGGSSGSALSKVTDFGKRVATIASGVAAGQWLHGTGVHKTLGMGLVKGTASGVGRVFGIQSRGRRIKNWYERQKESYNAMLTDTGMRPKQEWNAAEKRWQVAKDAQGNPIMEQTVKQRNPILKMLQGRAIAELASEKKLEKTKKQAEVRRDLARARIQARPEGLFQRGEENMDALDRIEQGMLEAEKARSADKTKEFGAIGRAITTGAPRLQYKEGKWHQEGETLATQRARHQLNAQRNEEEVKKIESGALAGVAGTEEGKKVVEAKIAAELAVKGKEGELKKIQAETKEGFVAGATLPELQSRLATAQKSGDLKSISAIQSQIAGLEGFEDAIAAGRAAHTAEASVGSKEKLLEEAYLSEDEHGIAERAKEARIAAVTAAAEASIKDLEGKAKAEFAQGEGRAILRKQAEAEQGAESSQFSQETVLNSAKLDALYGASGGTWQQAYVDRENMAMALQNAKSKEKNEAAQRAAAEARKTLDKTLAELSGQTKGGTKAESFVKVAEAVRKLAEKEKNPAIAAAYYKSLSDESAIMSDQSTGNLGEDILQAAVYNRRGWENMPKTTNVATVEKLAKKFTEVEREQIIKMFAESGKIIMQKIVDAKSGKKEYPEAERQQDVAYNSAMLNRAHKEGWIDDVYTETASLMGLSGSREKDEQDSGEMMKFLGTVKETIETTTKRAGGTVGDSHLKRIMGGGASKQDSLKNLVGLIAKAANFGDNEAGMKAMLNALENKETSAMTSVADAIAKAQRDNMVGFADLVGKQLSIANKDHVMPLLKTFALDRANRDNLGLV